MSALAFAAVFAALPVPVYVALLRQVVATHARELAAKEGVFRALRRHLAAREEGGPAAPAPEPDRAGLELLLAAWMLEPELEEDWAEDFLALLDAEMRDCG